MKKLRANTLKDAWNGIQLGWKEANFRFQVFTLIFVCLMGYLFEISLTEWCLVIGCFGAVLTAELINTSIEHIADFIHADFHPEIGKIKDISAGAVLISAIFSAIIGTIIFLPKILTYLG